MAKAVDTMAEPETFEKRAAEARRILAKYPDRVPVICEKAARSDLPDVDKKKFLVPGTMILGEFCNFGGLYNCCSPSLYIGGLYICI